MAISVDKSLKEAKLIPQNIDYVCAHGTATLYNDEMDAAISVNTEEMPELDVLVDKIKQVDFN